MNQTFILVGSYPLSFGQALEAAAGLIALLLLALVVGLARARGFRRREAEASALRQRELEQRMGELARSGAELNGRLQSMAEALGARQAELARVMAERLDNVSARVGAGIEIGGADDRRQPQQAQRTPRGDRRGAGAPHQPHPGSGFAEGHSRQQAGARRLRAGPHGGDRARRPAVGRL